MPKSSRPWSIKSAWKGSTSLGTISSFGHFTFGSFDLEPVSVLVLEPSYEQAR